MIRKHLHKIVCGMALSCALSGCGGGGSQGNPSQTIAEVPTMPAPSAEAETDEEGNVIAPSEEETTTSAYLNDVARTKYVRLEIMSKDGEVTVRIIDEHNTVITGIPFTVVAVPLEKNTALDKTLSPTIEGAEYSDEEGDGTVELVDLADGSYGIYLRPMDSYMYANPLQIMYAPIRYDDIMDSIDDSIKTQEEVDAKKEDNSYVSLDRTTYTEEEIKAMEKARDNAINIQILLHSDDVVGSTKVFDCMIPDLDANGEVRYEKLNSFEIPAEVNLDDYLTEENHYQLLVGGKTWDVYAYEEKRFDPRIEDTYISTCIAKNEAGVYTMYNLYPYMVKSKEDVYIGWYSSHGKTYYNDKNGLPLTGWQKLDGMWYYFGANGEKASMTGVDISQYQAEIDWAALKESDIDFVIIRCGFRGYGTGVLVEDSRFRENIEAAEANGIPYGVYIFSQAVNTKEAVEEAAMCMRLTEGYHPTLPYAIDIEACGTAKDPGRQNKLTASERTDVINAFDAAIRRYGGEAMVYACKSYLNNEILTDYISCKIWYAMWPKADKEEVNLKRVNKTDENGDPVEYNGDAYEADPHMVPDRPCEIWQYSDCGQVPGIEELVDLDIWIPTADYKKYQLPLE
ncbi:MAG: hypothetical protein K6C69_08245 [Lachnospiraceae bacterium]|nr:hypothetical protein [Lachnospiraceae bacterium]